LEENENKTRFVGHPKAKSQCILDITFEVKPLQAHSQTVNHLTFKINQDRDNKTLQHSPPLLPINIFLQGAWDNDVRF
jgi:hypothetical protein